jgi:predicted ribosome quality control (RQC) complex YloA/Tae2 family protein
MLKSAEIQDQINAIDAQIQAGASDAQLNVWEMQKSDLKKELETALADEAASNQQQAQVLQIGGLKSTLSSIFEATLPKDATVKLIGLTEYESTQQTFNQLVDQAVDEDQTALYAAFNTQLEQRDEKFRVLTSQALDVQNQLDKASGTIQTQAETIAGYEKTIDDLHNAASHFNNEMHQKDIEIESLGQQLENAKETRFNLQKQINNMPSAPQIIDITPTKSSTALNEKIAQAKIESVKKFSNFYSDVTFKDGTSEVVHNSLLPTLEIPVLPTLDQSNVEQGNNVEQVIHPSEIPTATAGLADSAPSVLGESAKEETPVTLESLKAEVDAIKSHLGLVA